MPRPIRSYGPQQRYLDFRTLYFALPCFSSLDQTPFLSKRLFRKVSNVGVPPRSILAVTFTKKAAEEMKARVRKVIGDEVASRVSLGTFHSVCARLLWRHGEALSGIVPGLNGRFSIYDKEDSRRVIKETMEGMGLGIDKVFFPCNAL